MLQRIVVAGLLVCVTSLTGEASLQSRSGRGPAAAVPASLSEGEIAEAMAAGQTTKGKVDLVHVSSYRPTYSAYFDGPFMRVSRKAGDAAEKYLPLTRASVSADDLKPVVRIHVQTSNQYGMVVEGAISGNKYAAVAPPMRIPAHAER